MKKFEEIAPELQTKLTEFNDYAAEEKRLRRKGKPYTIGTIAAFIGTIAVGWIPVIGWITGLVLFALVFILGFKAAGFSAKSKELKNQYKTKFLSWYFKALLGEETKYSVDTKLTERQVQQLKLFPKFNTLKAEDYIKSKWDGLDFEMTELHLTQENDEDYKLKFSGLFMIVSFQKELNGQSYVIPKESRKLLFNRFPKEHLDKLEDAHFHQYFDVYGANREFTRYLLSPSMMAKLTALTEQHKSKVYCLFQKKTFFLAIDWRKDLFEPDNNLEDPMANFKLMYDELATVKGIIDELRDSRQIWEGQS